MPCIRDLRVTVSMALGQLAGGMSIDDVLNDYPYLERADILAALEYAAAVVNERELNLRPLHRDRFVDAVSVAEAFRNAPALEWEAVRADLDRHMHQAAAPPA